MDLISLYQWIIKQEQPHKWVWHCLLTQNFNVLNFEFSHLCCSTSTISFNMNFNPYLTYHNRRQSLRAITYKSHLSNYISCILFFHYYNVDKTTRASTGKILQVNICLGIGKYLGPPSIIRLPEGIKLNSLKIECGRRSSKEGAKSLSKASKKVMIKLFHLLETK